MSQISIIDDLRSSGRFPTDDELDALDQEERARAGWTPDKVEYLRQIRRDQAEFEAGMPVSPPCPPWCVYEAGHRYEDQYPDGTYARFHQSRGDDANARVSVEELNRDGQVTTNPMVVEVWIGGNESVEGGCTAAEARRYARELLTAADDLERIERDQAARVHLDEQDAVADL